MSRYQSSSQEVLFLQDIYVAVDLAFGTVEVGIEGWEEGTTFELIEI